MKHLFLIRHAKSSWADPERTDFDRPLNKRGKRDAPFMGKRLAMSPVRPETIVSSPARRARKTAQAFAAELGYDKTSIIFRDDLYTFDSDGLRAAVLAIEESISALALVGHNPAITEYAEWLTGEKLGNVPTSGIVAISFGDLSWRSIGFEDGKLVFFDYPKRHTGRSDGK